MKTGQELAEELARLGEELAKVESQLLKARSEIERTAPLVPDFSVPAAWYCDPGFAAIWGAA